MADKAIIQVSKYPWIAELLNLCPDKLFLKLKWIGRRMPYRLDLRNPKSFNAKLQWMKLYDHNPLYTELVDKYKVKKYVSDRIGEKFVIPVLDTWESVDDIDWNALPDQFVIKCSHDCGGQIICSNKSNLDIYAAKEKLKAALKRNYFYDGREWPYKNVVPTIFAEKYMEDEFGELRDYKFFCFDGRARAMFIATDRSKAPEPYFDFFDMDFNHLPFTQGHPNAPVTPEKPKCFEEMKELAARLSEGLPQVRIDFYEVNGQVFFGEFTFFHFDGTVKFNPVEWDFTFGSWIELPEKTV